MNKAPWQADAPANIAIIKYMGKKDHQMNLPLNPSLSYTLAKFKSFVSLEITDQDDHWLPLEDTAPLNNNAGVRFIKFFQKLKKQENILENFIIRSGNNFPANCGLASSASSFAALTKAAYLAFSKIKNKNIPDTINLANISKTGSGSSCRSFFAPWCVWNNDEIYIPTSNLEPLSDLVVILQTDDKKISSSEAHRRVLSSPLIEKRAERAEARLQTCLTALKVGNFKTLAEVAWADSWEMHSMFHTSQPPFTYFEPETLAVLRFTESFWSKYGFGPLATIDAGPNIHLLMRLPEREQIITELKAFLKKHNIMQRFLES